jgi:hydrogenase maturation protease
MIGKLLIAGIGNIFLGDDAFGVEVVQRLERIPFPDDVVVKDFGIRSYDLAYALMQEWEMVILVDALPQDGEPGTLYTFEPDLRLADAAVAPDAHSMDPVAVFQLVRSLGGKAPRTVIVGCEPAILEADEEGRIGLSPPVAAAVDQAVKVVEELIIRARSQKQAA